MAPTYVIGVDGSGETSASLPFGLGEEAEWSPDGQWIVFSTLHAEGARAGGNSEIYLMRSDGSQRIQITDAPGDDYNPTWSPDGTRIAYVASAGITILEIDCKLRGDQCRPKPMFLAQGSSPTWSPDGKYIAYESFSLKDGIYVTEANGASESRQLVPSMKKEICADPKWSPNGKKIAFNCAGHVYVANSDGSDLKNLTRDKGGGLPKWSPDGSKLAFVSSRDGLGKCVGGVCGSGGIYSDAIFLMNADGNNVIRLSKRDDESVMWYTWLPSSKTKKP